MITPYVVLNPDGTYAGVPCESYEEARELAAQVEGRGIYELSPLRPLIQVWSIPQQIRSAIKCQK